MSDTETDLSADQVRAAQDAGLGSTRPHRAPETFLLPGLGHQAVEHRLRVPWSTLVDLGSLADTYETAMTEVSVHA